MRLVKLDPVEVGHVRLMELEPGKFFYVKTVAKNPGIFLIPDFLSHEECERIKSLAIKAGMHVSRTIYKLHFQEGMNDTFYNKETFEAFDKNGDSFLNMSEAQPALSKIEGVSSLTHSLFACLLDDILDADSDRWLNLLEFQRIPLVMKNVEKWMLKYKGGITDPYELKRRAKGLDRNSKQTWLSRQTYDESQTITNRIIALTGLHPDIVKTSEQLQVVHYTPGGHYHSHHDSSDIYNYSCSHTRHLFPSDPKSHLREDRLCRFMTILYFLADTEQGGETAFPAADNATFSTTIYLKNNTWIDPYDLTNHCKDANLVVKPRKGTAVMWYNHYLDPETEWLGDKNLFSLHGGCDVIKGEKWIANNWITVDNNYDVQLKFHYQQLYELKETKTEEVETTLQENEKTDQEIRSPENIETIRDEL